MMTGLALAVGMMAATANNQPELPPTAPPQTAPSWGATTPFQSGFTEPGIIPDTAVTDRWQGDVSLGGDVVYEGASGDVVLDGDVGCGCGNCGCGDCGCGDCGCGSCGKSKGPKMEHGWTQRCDMPQHIAYYPPAHGNYYFRPYSVAQLARQQEMVVSWGGDPRNPYSNAIFKQVYAETDAETIDAPASDATSTETPETTAVDKPVDAESETTRDEAPPLETELDTSDDGTAGDTAEPVDLFPSDETEPADTDSTEETDSGDDLFSPDSEATEDAGQGDDLFDEDAAFDESVDDLLPADEGTLDESDPT